MMGPVGKKVGKKERKKKRKRERKKKGGGHRCELSQVGCLF